MGPKFDPNEVKYVYLRTDLRGERRGSSNLSTHGPQRHILDFIRIELRSHLLLGLELFWLKCTKLRYVLSPLVFEWWMRAKTCSPYHGVAQKHVLAPWLLALKRRLF